MLSGHIFVAVLKRVFCRQYSESREVDLNKLRHLLEKNHTAVTKWRADAAEKAKVRVFLSLGVL